MFNGIQFDIGCASIPCGTSRPELYADRHSSQRISSVVVLERPSNDCRVGVWKGALKTCRAVSLLIGETT
jgi:hypothetical protein